MNARSQKPDFPPFQGRGWRFGTGPTRRGITFDPRWGRVEMSEGETDIKEAIYLILSSARGSRVMRPDFGCGIHELPFKVISSQLVTQIKQEVSDALRKFEARIDVTNVEVDTRASMNGVLKVKIDYLVRTTNQPGNFTYPYYYKEGS
jgi:phage baseplate assembly protein W